MRVLLLAGGGGTRLWPLSTEESPKQFLPLLSEKSLLAETYERLRPLTEDIFVATTARYADRVRTELGIPASRVLAEPSRRNSGPALLSAAAKFQDDGDPVTAVVPSDQTVADAEAFRSALSQASRAADGASVVVLAVAPARPETDFGYLELSESESGALEVARFIEKPGPVQAAEYVEAGYFWNAGIFVFRPSRLLAEARRVAPDLTSSVERYRDLAGRGLLREAEEAYGAIVPISIDYAVMEKADRVRAVPLRAGWNDVGSFRALLDMRGPSDGRGNLIVSDVPVLAPGVRDSAIVVTREGVLVLPFEREGDLRAAVESLKRDAGGRK